jgi:hypothetical protein
VNSCEDLSAKRSAKSWLLKLLSFTGSSIHRRPAIIIGREVDRAVCSSAVNKRRVPQDR